MILKLFLNVLKIWVMTSIDWIRKEKKRLAYDNLRFRKKYKSNWLPVGQRDMFNE